MCSASVWGGSHGKNVKPNHSRGKLAAQGIQILFSCINSVTHSVTMKDSNSERPGIIGGQRGCLHFRRLHQKDISKFVEKFSPIFCVNSLLICRIYLSTSLMRGVRQFFAEILKFSGNIETSRFCFP